jgi:hypothetical protein
MEAGEGRGRVTVLPSWQPSQAMTSDQIIEKLGPWLAKHCRLAWRPVVEDGDGPPAASKFSGTPWIGPDAPWPDCGQRRVDVLEERT